MTSSHQTASRSTDTVNTTVSAAVSAALVALIGVAIALIVTMGSWALAPHTTDIGPDTTARVAVGLWLYAHHVPLELGPVPLSLVPLGLLLAPALLTYAGGRQVARVVGPRQLSDVTRAVIPYALVYGVLAAVAAGLVRSDTVSPDPRTAFLAGTAIAAVCGGLGVLRSTGLLGDAVVAVPLRLRDVVAAATASAAAVLVVGAVLTTFALAVGFADAVEMYRALAPGWAGAPMLILITVAFVPNLVMWTVSMTLGVGFPLGAEGMVTPQQIDYGALPVFPPLAALPPQGEPGAWVFLGLVAPVIGGWAAASIVARRRSGAQVEHLAGQSAVGGALGGVFLGALAGLSSGSAGDSSLVALGPVGWQVGLVAALEMGLVAAVVAWEMHRRAGQARARVVDLRDRVSVPATAVASRVTNPVKALLRRR